MQFSKLYLGGKWLKLSCCLGFYSFHLSSPPPPPPPPLHVHVYSLPPILSPLPIPLLPISPPSISQELLHEKQTHLSSVQGELHQQVSAEGSAVQDLREKVVRLEGRLGERGKEVTGHLKTIEDLVRVCSSVHMPKLAHFGNLFLPILTYQLSQNWQKQHSCSVG